MDEPDLKARNQHKPVKKITETYLHNAGLYYLQRFAASSGQFRKVMTRKIDKSCRAHPDQNREQCLTYLDKLVESFLRSGLLNDEIYTTSAVNSLRRRGLSRKMIEMKLGAKGVPSALIKQTLSVSNDDDLTAAMRFAQRKKLGAFDTKNIPAEKQLATLARAGFSYDIARKVLDLSVDDLEEYGY